ncbi:MAG: alpha/beta hydrolase-fold protein [Bacteroidia bacterium]|nr:alpha/beta hydrolase-fold protein [Bacteroidia bacterium]
MGLTFELTTPLHDERPVYLTGTLNGWQTADERLRMTPGRQGRHTLELPASWPLPPRIEYKYTRGGWEHEELDAAGQTPPNRLLAVPAGLIQDFVPRWRNNGLTYRPELLPHSVTVSDRFPVPQLRTQRRVRILLPHDYHHSTARYPVLYLQDGQNLFDEHAPYGNWAIDRQLARLAEQGMGGLIVVAVDHGAETRIHEFSPYQHRRLGKGKGRDYARFKVQTLKPFIDQYFRTEPGRMHTGIGGSSMGGLISLYTGLRYSSLFGRLMIFSPSLWVSQEVYDLPGRWLRPHNTRIYLYAGGREGSYMIPAARRLRQALLDTHTEGLEVRLSEDPDGVHNEARWGREFPEAVRWMFFSGQAHAGTGVLDQAAGGG